MARSSARYQPERTETTHSFRAESAASLHISYSFSFTPLQHWLGLVALLIAACLATRVEISSECCRQRCQRLVKVALTLCRGLRHACLCLVWRRSLSHYRGSCSEHSSGAQGAEE